MGAPENVLLIRLKSIGDIVFTLPAVHQLRVAFPQASISYLVTAEYAPLLEGFRDVDNVVGLDRARLRGTNPVGIVAELFRVLRSLRRSRFSRVVDFQSYGETALLTWWSGARQRWGAVYRRGRQWAYTQAVARDFARHPADDFLALLHACGLRPAPVRNEFAVPAGALEDARRQFGAWGLEPAKPTLIIQPFTSSPEKEWPLEHYLAVGGTWRRRGVQVVFSGGPADRAALEPARKAGFPVSVSTSLLLTAGLMKLSTLVLGGDTGVLHLAVAMGRRVVMIMGSTGSGSSHPFQHPDWAVTPAKDQPIAAIPANAVTDACDRALAEPGVRAEG